MQLVYLRYKWPHLGLTMFQAQFPTSATRIEHKVIADINDSRITVLVVRNISCSEASKAESLCYGKVKVDEVKDEAAPNQKGTIIAFAKWNNPVAIGEEYIGSPWCWPEGTDHKVLEDWIKKTEEAQKKMLGDPPCYSML